MAGGLGILAGRHKTRLLVSIAIFYYIVRTKSRNIKMDMLCKCVKCDEKLPRDQLNLDHTTET